MIIVIFFGKQLFSGKRKPLYAKEVNRVNPKESNVGKISLKYFEARHVFVSANNFNHKLIQSIYQKKKVDNFQHFNDIVNSRGKASVMNFSNFSAFPKRVYESSQTSNKHKPEEMQAFKSQIFNIYAK